ncbi:hypothetical protein D3C78_1193390 [compost metagenome]
MLQLHSGLHPGAENTDGLYLPGCQVSGNDLAGQCSTQACQPALILKQRQGQPGPRRQHQHQPIVAVQALAGVVVKAGRDFHGKAVFATDVGRLYATIAVMLGKVEALHRRHLNLAPRKGNEAGFEHLHRFAVIHAAFEVLAAVQFHCTAPRNFSSMMLRPQRITATRLP